MKLRVRGRRELGVFELDAALFEQLIVVVLPCAVTRQIGGCFHALANLYDALVLLGVIREPHP